MIRLNPIRSGYNLSELNNNFKRIQDEMNNNLIHTRDGLAYMDQELDMNSNKVINAGAPTNDYDLARLIDVKNEPGRQGPPGPAGPRGPQGIQGPEGIQGPIGPRGQQGIQGVEGPQGPVGPTPGHEWRGSELRFIQGDGTWGNWEDLKGPMGATGPTGPQGPYGPTPAHQWNGTFLRFQQGDGTWGDYQDLIGPIGPQGIQGPEGVIGPTPQHEWDGSRLRFINSDGTWGQWEDVAGPVGPQGQQGVQGVQGVQGLTGPRGVQGIQGPIGPKGDKGDTGSKGDSFTVDEVGKLADKPNFDDRPEGFSYLAYDMPSSSAATPEDSAEVKVGDGTTTDFPIKFPDELTSSFLVSVGGAIQKPTTYTVTNQQLKFTTAPRAGVEIVVRLVSSVTGTGAIFFKLSNASGDWSLPIPFGKGPQGDKGNQGIEGPQGPQGPVGPVGPRGPQGDQGVDGIQGPPGDQGPRGPEGPKGVQGDRGLVGPQGPVGPQGERGPEGPKGVQGDKGLDGAQGPQGEQGERGPVGPKGVQGDKGIDGQQGIQGPPGVKGETGEQGLRGPQGFQGEVGATGPQGPAGLQGPQGAPGEKGAPGDKGATGEQGQRGSRTIYVSTNGTSWNPSLVQSAMQAAGYWPPVDYDLGTMYNPAAKFSTTYRWFNGRWDTLPVELVENGVLKIMNGVDSSDLLPNSVTEIISSTPVWAGSNTLVATSNANISGLSRSALISIGASSLYQEYTLNEGRSIDSNLGKIKFELLVDDVVKHTSYYNFSGTNVSTYSTGDEGGSVDYTWRSGNFSFPAISIDCGAPKTGTKRITVRITATRWKFSVQDNQPAVWSGISLKA